MLLKVRKLPLVEACFVVTHFDLSHDIIDLQLKYNLGKDVEEHLEGQFSRPNFLCCQRALQVSEVTVLLEFRLAGEQLPLGRLNI